MERRRFMQLMAGGVPAVAAAAKEQGQEVTSGGPRRPRRFGDGRDWFFDKRFGMFLHWGLYAIPARHEQHQWRARVPRAEYVKLAGRWNDFDSASAEAAGFERPTEACQSVGMESWGYRKDENYYTDRHLIRSLDRYLARDANYLLNVGPTAEGVIPDEAAAILRRIGRWYRAAEESLVDVEPASHLTSNRNVLLPRRDRTLYVHLNRDPTGNGVKLTPINVVPKTAVLLNDEKKVECAVDLAPSDHGEQKAYLRLQKLPANEMANTVLVVKLEFDRPLEEIHS